MVRTAQTDEATLPACDSAGATKSAHRGICSHEMANGMIINNLLQIQKKFFEPLASFMEDVETFLSRISDPKEMALAFPRLKNHRGKWHRIQKILPGLRLQEKEFRAYLTNVHESLPSFR